MPRGGMTPGIMKQVYFTKIWKRHIMPFLDGYFETQVTGHR